MNVEQALGALLLPGMLYTFLLSCSIYKISCGVLKATRGHECWSDMPMCPMRVHGSHWQVLHSAYMTAELLLKHASLFSQLDIYAMIQAQGAQAVQVSRRAFRTYMVERLEGSSSGEYEYLDMMNDSDPGAEPGESARAEANAATATPPQPRIIYDRLGQVVREPTGPPPIILETGDEDAEEDGESSAPNEDEAEDEDEDHNEANEAGPLSYELEPEYRHVSLAMSQAICEVLRRNGNRRAAFHVLSIPPASWRTTEGFVLQALPLTASTMRHPNILRCSDGPTFEPPRFGTTNSQEQSEMTDAELAEDAEMATLRAELDAETEAAEAEDEQMARLRAELDEETTVATANRTFANFAYLLMMLSVGDGCSPSTTGGLHSSRYNELLVWLVQQADTGHPVDLLFIQESHWRTDMEYSVKPAEDKALQYHVVHSAGDEKAGLLCMIRAGIVPTSHIRHQAPLPGRLMHIRLMLSTPVDFLNTYQFAWNVNKVATAGLTTKAKMESMLKQRRRVWKHLEQWMRTIPRRHGCLVVGDLNTPVATEAPITGPGVMESKKAQQQDQEVLMEILRVNSCTVLNSWTGTGLQLRTFIPPGPEGHLQGSQIDYLIARGDLSNQTSRRAAPFEAPFVPTTGCRHLPLQARIPVPKKRRPPAQDSRRIPPQQVCHIVKEPAHARQLQQRISMEIVNQGESIDLDEVMIREWDRTRQGLPAAQAPMAVLNQQHSIRDSVMEMWRLRAALRKEGDGGQAAEGRDGPSLKKLWDSWAKAARLQALTRQLRKDCRHKKTVRLLEVVHSENVFQAAKRFAPKQPRSRVQFRSPEGHLQSHEAEFAQIRSYFQDLFKGPDREPFRLPHQVEFTEEEISLALGRLAASKAMPSTNAPAALWKLMGDQVVPTLHRQLLDALSTGATTLPATWNVSELILLPKPGKAMTSPSQLRPINLLTLQAKIIGSMVASRLQEYVLRFLWDVPQFAYVQSRSMGQALERVAGQCAEIRRLLQAALVPDYMITLIMMIHREARCSLAPILWSAYSGWVLKRLHVSGVLNIPRCCTAYVDDFFYEWTVSSGSEMEVVYRAIRHVLAGLREQGLQLSLEKTAIILELRGQLQLQWRELVRSQLIEAKDALGTSAGPVPENYPWREDEMMDMDPAQLRATVSMLTRLVLRHDTQHAIARQDSAFVLFVRTDAPDSLAKSTYQLAQQWHDLKANSPDKLKHPMRTILFQHVIKCTAERFEKMVATPSSRSTAVAMDWMSTDEQMVNGLKWDSEARKHVKDDTVAPLRIQEVREALQETLVACVEPLVVARFHATRKLAAEYSSQTITMMLEIGLRTEHAQLVWKHLNRMERSGVWAAAGVYLRREGMQRSALGQRGLVAAAMAMNGLQHLFDGGMLKFVERLLSNEGIVHLWAQPCWAALVRTWELPERQHDGAEFILYLLRQLPYTAGKVMTAWQARQQQDDHYVTTDQGCSAPLLLQPPAWACQSDDHSLSVQELIDGWRDQDALHALVMPPKILTLQIGRFGFDHDGARTMKHRFKLVPDLYVGVPVFDPHMNVHHDRYRLCSTIVHVGVSPDSGHYFNTLHDADGRVMLADDNITARFVEESTCVQHYGDIYILFYKSEPL
ncbi:Pol [Symbiodinium sp. KB8]|nr:Pol [Symbiodinium sp. KB8]